MSEKSVKCEKYEHKWIMSAQGSHLISNGIISGTTCICGKKILIDTFCDKCTQTQYKVVVDTNSEEAKKWLAGK